MEREEQTTAEPILRRRPFNKVPGIPLAIVPRLHAVTAVNIGETIGKRSAKSPDSGVWGRFANAFLEPPNPFNPNARRQPKQDVVILGVLILAAFGLALYFNIAAATNLHSGF